MNDEGPGARDFWEVVDLLFGEAIVQIDRPRGSRHPCFPEFVYPLDYGFVPGTVSGDGEGIDVWLGVDGEPRVVGVFMTADPYARDLEIKLAWQTSDQEISRVRAFYAAQPQSAIYVPRPQPSTGRPGRNDAALTLG